MKLIIIHQAVKLNYTCVKENVEEIQFSSLYLKKLIST